ncbi:energy transducer TonB [Sediminicola luteus]|uniref:energy transducer TonB n=1 Tax=Sediminicola luteus TaxID=319238 RepID=UPI0015521A90|nr:energy transducer TonB [Sediminicola luteus]
MIGERVIAFVASNKEFVISKNDTLSLSINLKADKKGKSMFYESMESYLNEELTPSGIIALKKELRDFIGLDIKNLKDPKWDSKHYFTYAFNISENMAPIELEPTEYRPYSGGIIEEIPLFPGCKPKLNSQKRIMCFNKKMKEHISEHFNYPQQAMEMGISGKVSIMFTIGEDGIIRNKRYKGPHRLLTQEADRIVGKLPKMIPGKINGKPVKIPFAIPITFRL